MSTRQTERHPERDPGQITGARLVSRMVVSLLALVGALISFYLVLYHYGLTSLACPISGCDKVQASAYSSLLGVPLAAFGVAGFLGILGLGIAGLSSNHVFGLRVQDAIIVISALAVAAYLVLTYLELFVIHAICFWCVCSSLCMLGVLIAALLGARAETPPS
jgi:uncharacterized membrane protein